MIKEILTAAGVLHRQGRFLSPPAETYAVYFDDENGEGADPVGYSAAEAPQILHHSVRVEVYEPKPDDATEAAIEAEFKARGLSWSKEDRYWLQDVQRYQVLYETEYTEKT